MRAALNRSVRTEGQIACWILIVGFEGDLAGRRTAARDNRHIHIHVLSMNDERGVQLEQSNRGREGDGFPVVHQVRGIDRTESGGQIVANTGIETGKHSELISALGIAVWRPAEAWDRVGVCGDVIKDAGRRRKRSELTAD